MGNEANCQKFCDHKDQEAHEAMSQIKINEYPLQCQLCRQEVQHTNFKLHLDSCHYASIEQKNQHISVVCIFCQKCSENLSAHQEHLNEKHPYIRNYQNQSDRLETPNGQQQYKKNLKQAISTRVVKSRLKEIDTLSKIKIISQIDPNKWVVEYYACQYEMFKLTKQYNGMDYDQNQVFSELVLAPVVTLYKSSGKYYVIDKTPLQRTILCHAYILCDKN